MAPRSISSTSTSEPLSGNGLCHLRARSCRPCSFSLHRRFSWFLAWWVVFFFFNANLVSLDMMFWGSGSYLNLCLRDLGTLLGCWLITARGKPQSRWPTCPPVTPAVPFLGSSQSQPGGRLRSTFQSALTFLVYIVWEFLLWFTGSVGKHTSISSWPQTGPPKCNWFLYIDDVSGDVA